MTHSVQCYAIGGGPGHDSCVCYCHHNLPTVEQLQARLDDALLELDNIRWDDVLAAVAATDPELANWTRKYVGYVRASLVGPKP